MKTLPFVRPGLRFTANWLGIAVVALALCAGCVTSKQVQSIVAESNAAMLAAQLPDVGFGGDPASAGKLPDPAAVSKKIDDFIAAHPDQKVATSALRVRQAMLLIVHGEYEMARAAFADATELKTDRDKALKALAEPIIWWWEHSQTAVLNTAQLAQARTHLDAFDRELAKLNESPDTRDVLAEMRARISLKRVAAIQLADGSKKKDAFVDMLNHYGAIFTTNDIALLASGNLTPTSPAISTSEKRCLRALAVIEKAKIPAKALRDGDQAVKLSDLNSAPTIQGFAKLVLGP